MSNRKLFLSITAILIFSVLLLLPAIPVQATGPNFIEPNGFLASQNKTYVWKVAYGNTTSVGFDTGDKLRWITTNTNNSQTGYGWFADTIWGIFEYYNSTTGTWGSFGGFPVTEMFGFGYNSTNPISMVGGVYNLLGFSMPYMPPFIICKNLTHANHTIVNTTYTFFTAGLGSSMVAHISPIGFINNGSWAIMTLDLGVNNKALVYTVNSGGIISRGLQYGGLTYQNLELDMRLEVEKEDNLGALLLLAMMGGGGGGLGTDMIIIIGVVAAVGIIIIIIAVSKAKK